jgi:dimethylargininase
VRAFRRAIVRTPSATLAEGITTTNLGRPNVARALKQHKAYRDALERAGLEVTVLDADDDHPDATFVEDTAVLIPKIAIVCRPGAAARRQEAFRIRPALEQFFHKIETIEPPATVDGGDVLEADGHFFVGISGRTNPEGAERITAILEGAGFDVTPVDLRGRNGLLHLKSGVGALGEGRLAVAESIAGHHALRGWELVRVPSEEAYAANLIRVNDWVLMAEGFPALEGRLREIGYQVATVPLSEFQKMDGGASCLSLRF